MDNKRTSQKPDKYPLKPDNKMVASNSESHATHLHRMRGLREHCKKRVIGQDMAVDLAAEALLAGEMGHTQKGRPKSFVLILGPTGTGKTKLAIESSKYLYGTDAIARINVAEFSTEERVPLLLGGDGSRGLIGTKIDEMRLRGGKIVLLDEIEKGHKKVSDMFLGMEAAEITLGNQQTIDLSDEHIWVTSNVASAELSELDESMPGAAIRRVVETAAKEQFRPEVFARFTHVVIYTKLGMQAQLSICAQMLSEEIEFQSKTLSEKFKHTHTIGVGPGVFRQLVSEGYHRELGVRPMRNTVERRVRNALVEAQLKNLVVPGVGKSVLVLRDNHFRLVPDQAKLRIV